MATLRAMRLLQSIESKNTNTAALEALLTGNLSRQSDLPLLFSQRAATARILAAETFPVILGSASAAAGLSNSTLAMTAIAASVSAMTMVVASSTGATAMAANDIGAGIVLGSRAVYTATIGAATQASGIQTPWAKQWRWPARSVPSVPSQVYSVGIHPVSGLIWGPSNTSYSSSSSDGGATWTSQAGGVGASNTHHFNFAGTYFIGVPVSGGTNTFYSSSGASGGIATAGATVPNAAYSKAVAVGSMVVAVPINVSGTACVYSSSPTGGAYSAGVMPSSQYWGDVAASSTTFVSVAGGAYASTTVAATSANGAAWTARTLPSSQMWRSVTAGSGLDDGKFMAVGYSAATAAYSANHGVTWVSVTLPAGNWGRVVYHALSRAWIAFDSVVAKCATSTNDGTTWTTRTIPAVLGNTDVSAGGNYVISSSSSSALYVNF